MRLVCISDTHKEHEKITLPEGDVLIFAGDMCGRGSLKSVKKFNKWIGAHPHKHKIIIAGNHDFAFENQNRMLAKEAITNAIYLEDNFTEIDGVKFYGSPYQPEFCNWAFNLPRGDALKRKWSFIPEDTEVLITHGPPYGILDIEPYNGNNVGCMDLLEKIKNLTKLKAHIFGHIHDCYGVKKQGSVTFVNASTCNEKYKPINNPIVIEI